MNQLESPFSNDGSHRVIHRDFVCDMAAEEGVNLLTIFTSQKWQKRSPC